MKKHLALSCALVWAASLFSAVPSESASGLEKETYYRKCIEETAYKNMLPDFIAPGTLDKLSLLSAAYDAKAFTHQGDIMAKDRQKLLFRYGTTVFVSFVAQPNHPYTGLFASGAPYGLLRVSLGTVPSDPDVTSLLVGLALKFFIDGHESLNIMAMPSLDPQAAPNVFEFPYTTHLQSPKWSVSSSLLEKRFKSALWYAGQPNASPRSFSLDHLSTYTFMGAKVSTSVAPFSIDLIPTEDLHKLSETRPGEDFRQALEGKGKGEVLFEVVARGYVAQTPVKVGFIVATSNFMASSFGDEALFFKHPQMHQSTGNQNDEF